MVTASIPFHFLTRLAVPLNWSDILFGLDRGLIRRQIVIDRATSHVSGGSNSAEELELAVLHDSDDVERAVMKLASLEHASDELSSEHKWALILLAWIDKNHTTIDDPLSVIEEVYAEFGYPRALSPFVRYMPSNKPDRGSVSLNEARILEELHAFVSSTLLRPSKASEPQ
jgi:hypothetical protein